MTDDARTGKVIQGRYRLLERLAEGGMGIVYLAERIGIGRQVVVKFLHSAFAQQPGVMDRFEREARATARLNHPHCVALVDFGTDEDSPYLVMEYVEGQTLARLLEAGPLEPRRAVAIARQVLDGLEHAHQRGILHRDLKPANVMVIAAAASGDFVKILDFGLAKLAWPGQDQGDVTVEGMALGTPGYMSPEQASGTASDRRSDIYCTGTLLYHLVVGSKPFQGRDLRSVLRRHREATPALPRPPRGDLSAALERVIMRALERDPAARFQSAAEMAAALLATPEGSPASHPRRPARWRAAALALLVVAAGVGWTSLRWARSARLPWMASAAWRPVSAPSRARAIVPPGVSPVRAAPVRAAPAVAPAPASAKAEAVTAAVTEAVTKPQTQTETETDADPASADNDGAAEDTARPPLVPTAALGAEAKARAGAATAGVAPTLASVRLLLKRGDADGALAGLYRLRAQRPSAERASLIARWIGHVYFDRRWWTDALREYRFAITLERSARNDTTLIHNAVRALGDPATASRAKRLLRDYVGRSAAASVRRAADAGASPLLRRNAQLLATELDARQGKRRAAR